MTTRGQSRMIRRLGVTMDELVYLLGGASPRAQGNAQVMIDAMDRILPPGKVIDVRGIFDAVYTLDLQTSRAEG